MKLNQSKVHIYTLLAMVISVISVQYTHAQHTTHTQFRKSVFKTEQAAKIAMAGLRNLKNDTSKITRINELAKYLITLSRTYDKNSGYEQAIEYLKEGVRLSDSLYDENSLYRYESQMLLANVYMLSNRDPEGENLYKSVIDAYHHFGNKEGEAYAWYRLGFTLEDQETETDSVDNKMIFAFDRSILLYHEIGNNRMEIEAGVERAIDVSRFSNFIGERDLKLMAEKSIANGCIELPTIYIYLARLKRYTGNLNDALPYSSAALKTLRELGDTTQIANYYGEIALEYGELGRSSESIAYFKKCIAGREKKNADQYVIYRTTTLMTAEMIKNKQAAEGFEILKSLQLRNSPHGEIEKAIIEHGMANCLAASGRFDLAEKYYLSMISGYQQNERNGEILLIACLDITKFFVAIKKFKKAEAYYDKLLYLQSSTGIARKSEIALCLFKIDSARNRFQDAIRYYQAYKNYNDSIFNKVKSEQIEGLHIRYSSEQKDQNIALLTKQGELQQAKLSESYILRNSLEAGTIMLILLLTVLYSRYRLKTKNNILLEKQQDEISRKNFAQQLLLNEKDWLVREIHHRVKNNFHMVVGLMGTQSAYIKSSEALKALEDSKHRIQTMSLIHQKLYQSENLSATIMTDYIHELVSYLKDSFNANHILFVINCESIELELSYSLPIGLILNEAVTNSIKYAFPGNQQGTIEITLCYTSAQEIQLLISDNGVGIPVKEDSEKHASMGLNLMKGLTDDISGVFRIKNQNGTIIQINFPYQIIKYKETKIEQHTD